MTPSIPETASALTEASRADSPQNGNTQSDHYSDKEDGKLRPLIDILYVSRRWLVEKQARSQSKRGSLADVALRQVKGKRGPRVFPKHKNAINSFDNTGIKLGQSFFFYLKSVQVCSSPTHSRPDLISAQAIHACLPPLSYIHPVFVQ